MKPWYPFVVSKDQMITALLKEPGGKEQVEAIAQKLMSIGLPGMSQGQSQSQSSGSGAPQQARGPDGTVYTLVNGKYLDADGNEYKEQA